MSNQIPLLLASSSIYRQQLLSRLNLPFNVAKPEVDESRQISEEIPDLVMRLGKQKADKLRQTDTQSWIIASDQSAVCDAMLLEKPKTFERALEQLTHQQGKTVSFYTSLVLNLPDGKILTHLDETKVVFRRLQKQQLICYLEQEKPYDCAGAFKSEGLGIALFERIESRDPSALIGLPMIHLANWLTDLGVLLNHD